MKLTQRDIEEAEVEDAKIWSVAGEGEDKARQTVVPNEAEMCYPDVLWYCHGVE
jgi:hypothetical protein